MRLTSYRGRKKEELSLTQEGDRKQFYVVRLETVLIEVAAARRRYARKPPGEDEVWRVALSDGDLGMKVLTCQVRPVFQYVKKIIDHLFFKLFVSTIDDIGSNGEKRWLLLIKTATTRPTLVDGATAR